MSVCVCVCVCVCECVCVCVVVCVALYFVSSFCISDLSTNSTLFEIIHITLDGCLYIACDVILRSLLGAILIRLNLAQVICHTVLHTVIQGDG